MAQGTPIIGIDLGTTNSAVAVVERGVPRIIPDEAGEKIIPSVVALSPEGQFVVGRTALNLLVLHPDRAVRSVKRRMGAELPIRLGEGEYTPQRISAHILAHLRQMAETALRTPIWKAVITVPAFFSDAQRRATKEAGEIAGLEVVRIINEPTAAALAHGLGREADERLLVYDLGGGTFDVSVIEQKRGVTEVLASHGNNHLGGDDFDAQLARHLSGRFSERHPGQDLTKDPRALARLLRAAEAAKVALSNKAVQRVTEEFIVREGVRPLHLDMEVRRQEFQDLIRDLLDETLKSIHLALEDSGLKADQIQRVLLVGGSTRIPAVWELIRKSLGKEPHAEINPEEAVALGAAIQAAIISGAPVDSVLVDVAPHSLGVEYAEVHNGVLVTDLYQVMIRRNTTIPASASMAFYTLAPDQDTVEIRVYQGSDPQASRNTALGQFEFRGISPVGNSRRGREFIIQFDYDLDGIVHVSAYDRRSGKKKAIEVHTVRGGPARRRDLCFSPKDPSAEVRLKEVASLLERAGRLEEKYQGKGDDMTVTRLHELSQELSLKTEKGDLAAAGSAINDLYDLVYDLE